MSKKRPSFVDKNRLSYQGRRVVPIGERQQQAREAFAKLRKAFQERYAQLQRQGKVSEDPGECPGCPACEEGSTYIESKQSGDG